jgi:hypothetical protein
MIRKTIKGGDFKSQMVGELVFDQVPEEGSFNPVTSDAVVKAIDKAKDDMQEKIDEVTLDPSAVALGNVHLLDEVTEFPGDGCILVDSETKGPGEMSKDTLLTLTAQNALAGNVAPAFDPTKPNDAGGYAYYADEIVAYQGATYKFKVNHSSGAWNATEVDRYDAGDSLKFFLVTDNPEYLYAIADDYGRFLFGVKKDGSVEWQKGLPTNVRKEFEKIINLLSEKVDKVSGKSLIEELFAQSVSYLENHEFAGVLEDSDGKVLEGIGKDGTRRFKTRVRFDAGVHWTDSNLRELENALKLYGFKAGQNDWSDSKSLKIAEPRFAILNFSGIEAMPTTKTDDLNGFLEFWDLNGNYFKKRVIMNAQGQSTLLYAKKNIAIDICNDEWEGDDTFKLKIGKWVAQDSFHIKAFYVDLFRGAGQVVYDLLDEIWDTRGVLNRPWKKGLVSEDAFNLGLGSAWNGVTDLGVRIDTGADNHPLGFPCAVYLNGEFYGVFAFALKKHRDNYHQNKSAAKQIHLDGFLYAATFWSGNIDWTEFEVRNPKGLKTTDGKKYDGENPKELSDTDPLSSEVKGYIEDLSGCMAALESAKNTYGIESDEFLETFEHYFDIDNLADYIIFSDVVGDVDTGENNVQWVTYDGVKWWACPYDLDRILGTFGSHFVAVQNWHLAAKSGTPMSYFNTCNRLNTILNARFAELYEKGIVKADNVFSYVTRWSERIGFDFYKIEFERWPDSICNANMLVSPNWEVVENEDGTAVLGDSKTYDSEAFYNVGDTCFEGRNATTGYYKFRCVQACNGVNPVLSYRCHDSLWRLYTWCVANEANLKTLYNIN